MALSVNLLDHQRFSLISTRIRHRSRYREAGFCTAKNENVLHVAWLANPGGPCPAFSGEVLVRVRLSHSQTTRPRKPLHVHMYYRHTYVKQDIFIFSYSKAHTYKNLCTSISIYIHIYINNKGMHYISRYIYIYALVHPKRQPKTDNLYSK